MNALKHRLLKINQWIHPMITLPLLLLTLLNDTAFAMNPGEAAERVKQQTGGKILKVETTQDATYRVKVLMGNGQVRSIVVKPRSQTIKNKPGPHPK